MATRTATLHAYLRGDVADFRKKMEDAGKVVRRLGKQFTDFGKTLSRNITAPVVGATGLAIKSFAGFDKAMAQSTSIMEGLTDSMRKRLKETAFEVSEAYNISAREAAKGFYYLSSAGLSAEQSLRALPTAAAFATAAQTDLEGATELLLQSQAALGLAFEDPIRNAKEMARVSDVLSKANIIAIGSTRQFAEALSNKGAAAARMFNMEVEETVAVLAAFSQMGISGEQAGEAFNMVVRDIGNTVLKHADIWKKNGIKVYHDVTGEFLGVANAVDQLTQKLEKLNPRGRQAFLMDLQLPQRSVAYTKMLLGLGGAIRAYQKALEGAGGASDKMAGEQLKNVSDQFGILWRGIENTANMIVDRYRPALFGLIEQGKQLVVWFRSISAEQQDSIIKWGLLAAAAGPVLLVLGFLIKNITLLIGAIKTLTMLLTKLIPLIASGLVLAFRAAAAACVFLVTTPLGGLIVALGAVVTAVWLLRDEMGKAWDWITRKVSDAVRRQLEDLDKVRMGYEALVEFVRNPTAGIGAAIRSAAENRRVMEFPVAESGKAAESSGMTEAALSKLKETWSGLSAKIKETGSELLGAAASFIDLKIAGLATKEVLGEYEPELEGLAKGADKAQDALESLNKELSKVKQDATLDNINRGIQEAISTENEGAFALYRERLWEETYNAVLESHKEAIEEAGERWGEKAQETAEEIARFAADQQIAEQDRAWRGQIKESATRAMAEVAQATQGMFADIFSALGMSGAASDLFSKGLTSLFGESTKKLFAAAAPYVQVAIDGISGGFSALSAKKKEGFHTGHELAESFVDGMYKGVFGDQIGGWFAKNEMTFFGWFWDDFLAGALGLFGSNNPETVFRRGVADMFKEAFNGKKIKMVIDGELRELESLDFSKYTGFLETLPQDVAANFIGIGEALSHAYSGQKGWFAEFGGQLAQVLAANVGGSILQLQVLMERLGMSSEDMIEKVREAWLAGDISAEQYLSTSNSINQVMSDGIPNATGAIGQALQDTWDYGLASGQHFWQSLKNAGKEAEEIGVTTWERFREEAIKAGQSVEQVDKYIAAMRKNGITDPTQLIGIDPDTAARIQSDMKAMNVEFKEVTKSVKEVSAELEKISKTDWSTTIDVYYKEHNKPAELSGGGGGAADGGGAGATEPEGHGARGAIITGPGIFAGLAQLGEAGSEAVLPLSQVNGKLGVLAKGVGGSGVTLNINASHAAPGVENAIRRTVAALTPRLLREAAIMMSDNNRRGR